jgi:hypothetical protein
MTGIVYFGMAAIFHLLLTRGGFGRREEETTTGVFSLKLAFANAGLGFEIDY